MPAIAERTELALVIPDSLSTDTRASLEATLRPIFASAEPLCVKARTIVVTDADDRAGMKNAADTRKAIKAIRVSGEKKRKELKEDALRTGQAIDAIFRPFDTALSGHEEYLLQQEQFAERAAAAALAQLKADRDGQIAALGVDPAGYNTSTMTADTFSATLEGIKAQQKAVAEAAAKFEADRLAKEKADASALQSENAKLKADLEAREAAMKVEREAAEQARREAESAAKKERDAIEAKAKAERDAREAAEAQLRQKEKAETDAKAAAEKAAKKAAAAPDKTKILAVAKSLRQLVPFDTRTEEAAELVEAIVSRVESLASWIEKSASNL